MINPGLIVALAAFVVLVQIGLSWWLYRDLERRLTGRIDELNRLVSALLRAVQAEAAAAKDAVANTELALADIARNERTKTWGPPE